MLYARYGLYDYRGNFSDDGIKQIGINGSYFQCTSAHLTSFAVLVDASGEVGSVSIKWPIAIYT